MRLFLDTAPLSADEQPSVADSIRAVRRQLRVYRAALEQESIWLFLSTVGCWGIPDPLAQVVAYLFTGWLFGHLMKRHLVDARSFTELTNSIEKRIHAETEDASLRATQLLELSEFRELHLRSWKPYLASRVFLACWLFYAGSMAAAVVSRFRHLLHGAA